MMLLAAVALTFASDRALRRAAKLAERRPYDAATQLAPMLDRGPGAKYHLARSLLELEMPMAAEPYLFEVVGAGSSSGVYEAAATLLVEVVNGVEDLHALIPLADIIPREALPGSAQSELLYLQGLLAVDSGDLPLARRVLDDVMPPTRPLAKFQQALVFAEQGKLRSAVGAFLDVHQASADGRVDASPALRDVAMMNVARIYYGLGRHEEAKSYYNTISRKSPYWEQALLESGWAYFMTDHLEPSLARVLTAQQDPDIFLPEAVLLECLVYFSAAAYDEADDKLFAQQAALGSLQLELETLIAQGQGDPSTAWAILRDEGQDRDLPRVLRSVTSRDRDTQAALNRVQAIDAELLAITVAPGDWQLAVGKRLEVALHQRRVIEVARGGQRVVHLAQQTHDGLRELLTQIDLLRFEIAEARRKSP